MSTVSKAQRAELERIRKSDPDGVLRAEKVVEFASDPSTALHKSFDWDDSSAAHQHRLSQAERIIRLSVEVIQRPNEEPMKVRAYCSLPSDRKSGGGYRLVSKVVKNSKQFAEYKAAALAELTAFRDKYQRITTLTTYLQPVYDAIKQVEKAPAEKTGRQRKATKVA